MSDKKLWASLCTVTPLSGPEIVQIYSGPLWETNATTSPAFQHQLRDAGIPEINIKNKKNLKTPSTVISPKHKIVQK